MRKRGEWMPRWSRDLDMSIGLRNQPTIASTLVQYCVLRGVAVADSGCGNMSIVT